MLKYAKAIVAGTVTLCGGLATALTDGHLSVVEILTIIPATILAVGTVFGVTNSPGITEVDPAPNQD